MTVKILAANGLVSEVLKPIDGHTLEQCYPKALLDTAYDAPDEVQPGWAFDGTDFSEPPALPPVETPVPPAASKLGLKRALSETGDRAVFSSPQWQAVKDLLAKDADMQEDWDLATEVRASDPLVLGAVKALKWKTAQVNALLIRANELVA